MIELFTLKLVLGQKVWYIFWFPWVVFSGFIPYWIYQDTIVNTNFHWFEQVFLFFSFFVLLGSFVVVGFFFGGEGCFFFKCVSFSQWQKIENGFKKKRKFPYRQYMCRFALKLSNLSIFFNVRQTGLLYLLICIYVYMLSLKCSTLCTKKIWSNTKLSAYVFRMYNRAILIVIAIRGALIFSYPYHDFRF